MRRLLATLFTLGHLLFWINSPTMAADIKTWTERAETGDSQRVLRELAQYLKNNPDDYPAMFLQGRLQAKHGDMQAAMTTYRRLIEQQPSQPEAYNNLAALYAQRGDYEQAQQLLEQAMRAHPSYAAIYENLSHIYVESARSSYGKALQLDAGKEQLALQELKAVAKLPLQSAADSSVANSSTVVASSLPKKSVEQKVTTAPTPLDEDAIITTLHGWAAAWSEQATDVYFIFYANDYVPAGMTRQQWEQERRARLNKPQWIQIDLSEFKIKPLANGEAKVEMIQEYRASNYQDKTKKLLRMRQTPDGWRIVAEQSIAKLN